MTDLPWARMRQPDQRSCGPSAVVAARMLLDRSYADAVRDAQDDRFASDVLTTHRRATSALVGGRLQVPWPRALGTPPWAVARELSAVSGPGAPARSYRWRVAVLRPGSAFDRAATGVDAGRPVGLYVGNAWLPRHVVLVVGRADDDALWVYDPARGARVEMTRASVKSRALTFGRWDRLWFDVSPR
ncbi:cysteine peptidase family C39 domain-containing protein [Nocardioides dilutus]